MIQLYHLTLCKRVQLPPCIIDQITHELAIVHAMMHVRTESLLHVD